MWRAALTAGTSRAGISLVGVCIPPSWQTLDEGDQAMKRRLGTRSWPMAAWTSDHPALRACHHHCRLACRRSRRRSGFVVPPGADINSPAPQGTETDVTEMVATGGQTGGALGLVRQTIAPKRGPPPHIHQAEDESSDVVSGEFKVKLGDRILSAPAQSVLFVPRGTAHAYQNVGTAWRVAGGRDASGV